MRTMILSLSVVGAALVAAQPASAATVYVFVDPMTLEQRGVKVTEGGPDRAYVCMLPPATSGCQRIEIRRER